MNSGTEPIWAAATPHRKAARDRSAMAMVVSATKRLLTMTVQIAWSGGHTSKAVGARSDPSSGEDNWSEASACLPA